MTSAPNHQPLLSGNRIFLFLLPILLLSCGAVSRLTGDSEGEIAEEVIVEPIKEREVEEVKDRPIPAIEILSTVSFHGETYRVAAHKKDFEIAVLLPFHLSGTIGSTESRRKDYMLEYYQGMLLAAKNAQDLDSRFRIKFYDTDNDTTRLKQILQRSALKRVDLIIGPTDEDQVRIAAHFARKHKIILMSPLTTIDQSWSTNHYLYNLRPSDQMQAQSLVRYIKQQHIGKKVIVLRDGKYLDKSFGVALISALEQSGVSYEKHAIMENINWEARLGEQNLVISLAQDKTSMTRIVNQLLPFEEQVTVMGPDRWLEMSSVDFTYWSRLKMHFFSENLAQVPNERSKEVSAQYRAQYRNDPSWFTYRGFDHLLFSCELLDAFGTRFPNFVEDKRVYYANTAFCLTKANRCYQNNYIQVFKYENFEVVPEIMR